MAKHGTNGYISASDFIAAITVTPVDLAVPGLGTVQVRGLTLMEMQTLAEAINDNPRRAAIQAISIGLVNPSLEPDQIDQLDQFKAGAVDVINVISSRIFELSAIGDVEELEGKAGAGS